MQYALRNNDGPSPPPERPGFDIGGCFSPVHAWRVAGPDKIIERCTEVCEECLKRFARGEFLALASVQAYGNQLVSGICADSAGLKPLVNDAICTAALERGLLQSLSLLDLRDGRGVRLRLTAGKRGMAMRTLGNGDDDDVYLAPWYDTASLQRFCARYLVSGESRASWGYSFGEHRYKVLSENCRVAEPRMFLGVCNSRKTRTLLGDEFCRGVWLDLGGVRSLERFLRFHRRTYAAAAGREPRTVASDSCLQAVQGPLAGI